MELSPNIAERIDAIRSDEIHGASWLSRQALDAIALAAAEAPVATVESVLRSVRAVLHASATARPEMISIRHWVDRLARAIDDLTLKIGEPNALREAIEGKARQFAAQAEVTNRRSIENTIARLTEPTSVFTASYSQSVVDAIRLAVQLRKLTHLLIAESVDPSGQMYGRRLALAIVDLALPVEIVPDTEIASRISDVDRIWLGADTILPDGSLLNGVPSLALAKAANAIRIPVEIIGESAKVEFPSLAGPIKNVVVPPGPAGMERVPSELIDVMITEDGPIYWPLTPLGNASPAELATRIGELLVARGEFLGVVESGAGGRIGDLLTNQPGSSAWFRGSLVAYSNASKLELAGVSSDVLTRFGAASAPVAMELAHAAVAAFGATWGIGETGLAGPQVGRRSAKEAGLAYLAVAGPNGRQSSRLLLTHHDVRDANKQEFALAALRLLAETIIRENQQD